MRPAAFARVWSLAMVDSLFLYKTLQRLRCFGRKGVETNGPSLNNGREKKTLGSTPTCAQANSPGIVLKW
jgi:hypothetical protein